MFLAAGYRPVMPDTPHLRPATADEIADALSFALRYQGRKRVHHADDMMARITAERLIQHLTASGVCADEGAAACGTDDRRNAALGGLTPPRESPTAEAAGELKGPERRRL